MRELTVFVDVHETVMSCIQENPNFYISKDKTERGRKESSLEIRKQMKIISTALATPSIFLNT